MQNKITKRESDFLTTKQAAAHPLAADIKSLSAAGTMQLRTIAKIMHVKNYSKLPRDQLIMAIVAKKEELWQKQQQELWPEKP